MLTEFTDLFYPRLCINCNGQLSKRERYFCAFCRGRIPYTHFYRHRQNPMQRALQSRAGIYHASAFLYFQQGNAVQKVLHQLKYHGDKAVGVEMGAMFGTELSEVTNLASVDFLLPVPLHPARYRMRGFNQSSEIAKGMSITMGKKVREDVLKRAANTKTQTTKNRAARWQNVSDIFALRNPFDLSGKHVLIVDDVFTTGATMEACVASLKATNALKISAVTLAFADY